MWINYYQEEKKNVDKLPLALLLLNAFIMDHKFFFFVFFFVT